MDSAKIITRQNQIFRAWPAVDLCFLQLLKCTVQGLLRLHMNVMQSWTIRKLYHTVTIRKQKTGFLSCQIAADLSLSLPLSPQNPCQEHSVEDQQACYLYNPASLHRCLMSQTELLAICKDDHYMLHTLTAHCKYALLSTKPTICKPTWIFLLFALKLACAAVKTSSTDIKLPKYPMLPSRGVPIEHWLAQAKCTPHLCRISAPPIHVAIGAFNDDTSNPQGFLHSSWIWHYRIDTEMFCSRNNTLSHDSWKGWCYQSWQ